MVSGSLAPGFEEVHEELLGTSRTAGNWAPPAPSTAEVVDLSGGRRNGAGGPCEEDTLVLVFSAAKGLSAMPMAVAHSRGLLRYDETVSTYWPEFFPERQAGHHRAPAAVPSGRTASEPAI